MKKILFSILLLAFLSACADRQEEAPEAGVEQTEPPHSNLHFSPEQLELAGVELGKPEKRIIREYIACTGMVEVPPQSLYSVHTPAEGFVESVPYILGDYVKKGAVLTRLSHPSLLQLQRDFLESAGRLPYLQQEYERLKVLSEKEAAPRQTFQKAEAEWKAMEAHYRGTKKELQLIGIDAAQLEAGGDLQTQIAIRAPASGYLTRINVNPGKLAQAQEELFQLVDKEHMHLELQVFARDAPRIRKGAPIRFHASGSSETYRGEVFLLGQMIDPETKTTRVHGHFEEEPVPLLPGTYVQAEIAIPSDSAWAVPEAALIREGEKAFIFLMEKEDHFVKKEVKPGRSDGEFTELTDFQLPRGSLLALQGAYYLNAGGEEEMGGHDH